jgi:hypothetical protein
VLDMENSMVGIIWAMQKCVYTHMLDGEVMERSGLHCQA